MEVILGKSNKSAKYSAGSFNFAKVDEEKNAENLLIIKSKELAKNYIENWDNHKKHSNRYEGK